MKPTLELAMKQSVGGRYRPVVINRDGSIAKVYPWSKNLILPAGVGSAGAADLGWTDMLVYCHAGTGTTPNSAVLSGTFQQSGTTVTRASGVGVFASGNVNDFIKFASGEFAKIISFTNTLTVEVDRSQTVAAAALTIYDTSRVTLDAWVRPTNTYSGSFITTQDTDARSTTFVRKYDFAFETVAHTYTEIGISRLTGSTAQLLSRVVLDSSVSVDVDQFLQIEFALTCEVTTYGTSQPIDVTITGWPRPYSISSIVANGTYWDITLTENHHYAAGRPVIVGGALPAAVAISSITSTALDFTVNTSAVHNKSPGDSIVIGGATPSGYNATWTVATVVDADTLTVTDSSNLGAGSGGTLRLATPGGWYNGTLTAASFPAANKIRVTNATSPPDAGAFGTVTNSTVASCIITGMGYGSLISGGSGGALDLMAGKSCRLFSEADMKTGLAYGVVAGWNSGVTGSATQVSGVYSVADRTYTYVHNFPSAVGNGNVRQLTLSGGSENTNSGTIAITFDERQVKEVGFALQLTWKHSWEPALV